MTAVLTPPSSAHHRGQASWTPRSALPRSISFGVMIAVLAALPFVASVQSLVLMNRILVIGLMAASLVVLLGSTGLPSLGHGTFAGIGGYAAALVAIHWTTGAISQVVVAIAASAAVAAAIGWIAVRSGGIYFLLLTLTIGQLAFYLVESLSSITGGANGLAGVPPAALPLGLPTLDAPALVYWYVLGVTLLGYVLLRSLVRSPFGLVLNGIRDNERRMVALGYRTGLYKYAAFSVAGAVAGLAGALNVTQQQFVSPDDVGYHLSALLMLAVIIGGRTSLLGAFAGAAVIVLVQNELSAYFAGYGEVLLGAVFVAIILFMPSGIEGALKRVTWTQLRRALGRRAATAEGAS